MTELMEQLRAQIADALQVPAEEIDFDDELMDHGLDSIRVMVILESWRARGVQVGFADLAQAPTVRGWAGALARAMAGAPEATA